MGMHGPDRQPGLTEALRFLTQAMHKGSIPEGIALRGQTSNGEQVLRPASNAECPTGHSASQCVTFTVPLSSLRWEAPLPLRKVYALQENGGPLVEEYKLSLCVTERELRITFPVKSLKESERVDGVLLETGIKALFRLLEDRGSNLQQKYPSFLETPIQDGAKLLQEVFGIRPVEELRKLAGEKRPLVQGISNHSLLFSLPFKVDVSNAYNSELFEQSVKEGNHRLSTTLQSIPSLASFHEEVAESDGAFYLTLEESDSDSYCWKLQVDLTRESRTAGILPLILLQAVSREQAWFLHENPIALKPQRFAE